MSCKRCKHFISPFTDTRCPPTGDRPKLGAGGCALARRFKIKRNNVKRRVVSEQSPKSRKVTTIPTRKKTHPLSFSLWPLRVQKRVAALQPCPQVFKNNRGWEFRNVRGRQPSDQPRGPAPSPASERSQACHPERAHPCASTPEPQAVPAFAFSSKSKRREERKRFRRFYLEIFSIVAMSLIEIFSSENRANQNKARLEVPSRGSIRCRPHLSCFNLPTSGLLSQFSERIVQHAVSFYYSRPSSPSVRVIQCLERKTAWH